MTPFSRRDAWTHRALLLTIAFAIFAFGAVHRWASAIVEIGIWGIAIASLWPGARRPAEAPSPNSPRWVVAFGLGLLGYLLFQSTPLPPSLLEILSPTTADLYRRTVDVVATSTGTAAGAWRPLALHPVAERAEILRIVAYLAVMIIASRLRRPRRLLGSLTIFGIFVAVFSLVQAATWNGYTLWFFAPLETGPRPQLTRVTGPFVNPDHFALLLELVLAITAASLLEVTRRTVRRLRSKRSIGDLGIRAALLGIGMAVVIGALLGTASRGGIIGGFLGLLVVATGWSFVNRPARSASETPRVPAPWSTARTWALRTLPVAIALAIVSGGLMYAGPRARTELDVRLSQSLTDPDLGYRVDLWNQSLRVTRDFPTFGVGLQSWGEAFPRYRSYPLLGVTIRHAHNDYIEWATEVGAFGTILTLLLVLAYVHWASRTRDIPVAYRFGVLGALVAMLWHEFFDFGLRVPANGILLAVLLGLMANAHWRAEKPERGSGGRGIRELLLALARRRSLRPARRVRRRRKDRPAGSPVTEVAARVPLGATRLLASAILLVAAGFLTLGSARKLAESVLWQAAFFGSPTLALTPRDATTWLELARHLPTRSPDDRRRQRDLYRKAIELRPAYTPAYLALARFEPDPARRLELVDAAIFANPTEASLRLARAALLEETGRAADALREIERTAHDIPLSKEHAYLRAETSLHPTVRDAADRGFRRALAERPDDPTLMNEVAQIYAAAGRWADAGDLWTRAAETSQDWGSYGWAAGESYRQARLYDRAEKSLRKAIEIAPDEGVAYWTLAVSVLLPQKKHADAEAVLEQALRRPLRQIQRHGKQRAGILEGLYRVRWDANDRRHAIEALREAARIERTDARLQYELGLAYLRMESYDLASSALKRAIAIDDRNALYHYYRGIALEKTDQLAEAIAAYQRANQLQPDPSILQALARTLAAADRARRASD